MNKIIVLGTMEGYEKLNRVYSIDGISPTIETMQGGADNHISCVRSRMSEYKIKANNQKGYELCKAGGCLMPFTRRADRAEGASSNKGTFAQHYKRELKS